MRAQTSYRASFATDLVGTVLVGLTELAEVYVIFHNVPRLGGLTFSQALLVFALANIAYSLGDMVVGHLDQLPTYIRAGTIDVFYLRPLPLLAQLVTSDISLRRFGRLGVALAVLVAAITGNDIRWSPTTVSMMAIAVLAGTAIVAATLHHRQRPPVLPRRGVRAHQRLHLRWLLRRAAVRAGLLQPPTGPLHVRRPGSVHRLSARGRHPRPARRTPSPGLARVAHATRRARVVDRGAGAVAGRDQALPRSRRMSTPEQARPILELADLTRVFRRRAGGLRRGELLTAVDRMSFAIQPGESVGYIGANGAGKSTTIKMLTGILRPTSGSVRTCGLDPMRQRKDVARRVGVVFGQRSQLWWDLPLHESLTILGAIHGMSDAAVRSRAATLVEQLEMAGTLDTAVRQLSLGQRMRAEIAAALMHSPHLLILDEPTIGLDVLSKQRLREFLRRERAERGTTLLLTTHDMGDIERLCDRVLVVDRGRLAFDGTLTGLGETVGARRVLVVDLASPTEPLHGIRDTTLLAVEGDGLRQRLAFDAAATTAAKVLAEVSARAQVLDLAIEEPDIEDVVRRIYSATR